MERFSSKQFISALRQFLNTIKAREGCKYCPERHPACLDFHHRPGEVKILTVSQLCGRGSWALIQAEIDKCDIVCSNCHRKRHYSEETGCWKRGRVLAAPFAVPIASPRRRQRALDRLLARLAVGPHSVRELAVALNTTPGQVRALLSRHKTMFRRESGKITIQQQG